MTCFFETNIPEKPELQVQIISRPCKIKQEALFLHTLTSVEQIVIVATVVVVLVVPKRLVDRGPKVTKVVFWVVDVAVDNGPKVDWHFILFMEIIKNIIILKTIV